MSTSETIWMWAALSITFALGTYVGWQDRGHYDRCVVACMADDEDRPVLTEEQCEKICW